MKPTDILARSLEQLDKYKATLHQKEALVTEITRRSEPSGIYDFSISFDDGTKVDAKRVILATGVVDELPAIEGLKELWGKKVHICPFCDGYEYGNEEIGVLATDPMVFNLVNMLNQQWTPNVSFFVDPSFLQPAADGTPHQHCCLPSSITLQRLKSNGTAKKSLVNVYDKEGNLLRSVSGVFAPTLWKPQSQLAKALGADLHPKNFIMVNTEFETSVEGLSAVGDVAWLGGGKMPVSHVAEAVGSGARAAAWASIYLIGKASTAAIKAQQTK
jgi:thioredoxin reductase